NQFLLDYVDGHRAELEKEYPTLQTFIRKFEVDSSFLAQVFEYAKTKKVVSDSAENYSKSIPTIKNQLKGLLAQNLFNTSAYYQVTNEQNLIFLRALKAFTDGSFKKFKIDTFDDKKGKVAPKSTIKEDKKNRTKK
ncbi:MAG TPA: hypothetical protein PLL99_06785, partial [Chitinophagales bacterium]|nr:hypothetical protein [Chitinophagales bacterium]